MSMAQFCLKKILGSALFPLIASYCLTSSIMASEAPKDAYREVTTYYQITSESLEFLSQRVSNESAPLVAELQVDLVFEDYVASLGSADYAMFVKQLVQKAATQRFEELVDGQLSGFYDIFVDKISDDVFAAIFRQYLGELTASYLTSPSNQDFTQYVLSRTLQLSELEYSNLYRDYIATLWRYYVTSATSEELTEILGEEYPDPVTNANIAIEDEQYFDLLAEYITNISEDEFLANYRFYVTQMIGGLLTEPVSSETEIASEPEAAPESETETDSDAETEIDAGAETESQAQTHANFTDLSTEESVRLIRRHIASIAQSYFIAPFREDIIESSASYTNETSNEQLALLLGLEDFSSLVQQELDARNDHNQQALNFLTALTSDTFLGGVRSKLQLVENIPYPNMRLLQIAVLHVLDEYRLDSPSPGEKLPDEQFQILDNAILGSAVLYDASGPIAGPEIPQNDSDETTTTTASAGEVSWDFLGCGCDLNQDNIIYGFYPTWYIPSPGSPAQEIDLRFYDRVAYFGLTLDERGDISDDEYWREGGVMNDFIQNAHIRDTYIDLAIYSPTWHLWGDSQITTVTANIIDKLSLPLQFGLMTRFADKYLTPIYPTYSETIGKNTMGDGLTLYFDNLEKPDTGGVRNLDMIVRLVSNVSNELERKFDDGDVPPINLMLDFKQENTVEILEQLRPLILGTQAELNQYVERVLIFLEQDTWGSSQNLIEAVRTVFKDDDSAAVLRKLNPILIPAMDESREFPSLTRDLRDLRWSFGNAGGAAIWPIPLEGSVNGKAIEDAFNKAMVEGSDGFWQDILSYARIIYFQARLSLIFSMTGIYLISMMVLIWSIREPIKPVILLIAKTFGSITFVLFMLSANFIDPYINSWRIVFFLLPILFVIAIVPLQSSMPDVKVNVTGNKYMNRKVKMQKKRILRGLGKKIKRGIWSSNES